MRTFQFLKVDWIRCKGQLKVMFLFPVVALIFLMTSKQSELFAIQYLVFGALVFSAQPFNMEQMSESGYINMLPGTKRDRVMGRYLYAFMLLVWSVFMGIIVTYFYDTYNGIDFKPVMGGILIIFAVGMIISSLQYILYYAMGKGKSQQMMGIIRMIPAFIMFFLGGYVTDLITEGKLSALDWIMAHNTEITVILVAAGILLFVMGIAISSMVIKNKDFA